MSTLAKITKDLHRLNEDGKGLDRIVVEATSAVGIGANACNIIESEIRLRGEGSLEARAFAAEAQRSLNAARSSLADAEAALGKVTVGRQKGKEAIAAWLAEHGAGAGGGGRGAVGRARTGDGAGGKAGEVADAAAAFGAAGGGRLVAHLVDDLMPGIKALSGAGQAALREGIEEAREELGELATEVREKLGDAVREAREEAAEAVEDALGKVGEIVDGVRDRAGEVRRDFEETATGVRERIGRGSAEIQRRFREARDRVVNGSAAVFAAILLDKIGLKEALTARGDLAIAAATVFAGPVGGVAVALIIGLGKPFLETVVSKVVEGGVKGAEGGLRNFDWRAFVDRDVQDVVRDIWDAATNDLREDIRGLRTGTREERGVIALDWTVSISLSLAETLITTHLGAPGKAVMTFVSPVLAGLASDRIWALKHPRGSAQSPHEGPTT